MHVGQTIHDQLHELNLYSFLAFNGYRTKQCLIDNGLKIALKRGGKTRVVQATYDEGADLYKLGVYSGKGDVIVDHSEVFAEDMPNLIIEGLEKKLATV